MKVTGIHCPGCGKRSLRVVATRPVPGGIRRRRECNLCGFRCSTIETVVSGVR